MTTRFITGRATRKDRSLKFAMKNYVVTATLVVASAIPAFAGSGAYYVGLRLGGRSCTIMTHTPNPHRYKMMGKYGTRADANKAIAGMSECH